MIRVGINGFGRIGRTLAREILKSDNFKLIQVNDIYDKKLMLHLLRHDSVYGEFDIPYKFKITNSKNIEDIFWDKVDILIEASGAYSKKSTLWHHLKNGAKKVILSAYSKELPAFIYGLNDKKYNGEKIISASSCTGNCVTKVIKTIDEKLGIKKGTISTIHSYTTDQNLLDNKNKDTRRARSSTQNIIPLSSNVANALIQFIPHLKDKIVAQSIRIPTIDGVMIDINLIVKNSTDTQELSDLLKNEADGKTVYFTQEKLVSSDIIKLPYSAVIDANLLNVTGQNMVKIVLWQDNEFGYANRLIDLIKVLGE